MNAEKIYTPRKTPATLGTKLINRLRKFFRHGYCLAPSRPRDIQTDELRRHADNLLEAQSALRVRRKLQQRGIVDYNGFVKEQLFAQGNVVRLPPRRVRR